MMLFTDLNKDIEKVRTVSRTHSVTKAKGAVVWVGRQTQSETTIKCTVLHGCTVWTEDFYVEKSILQDMATVAVKV